jgi:hypothetical protein
VLTINGIGFVIEAIYIAIFFTFSPRQLRVIKLLFLFSSEICYYLGLNLLPSKMVNCLLLAFS